MDVLSGVFMCVFVINFISAIVTDGNPLLLLLAGLFFAFGWITGLACLTKRLNAAAQKIVTAIKKAR